MGLGEEIRGLNLKATTYSESHAAGSRARNGKHVLHSLVGAPYYQKVNGCQSSSRNFFSGATMKSLIGISLAIALAVLLSFVTDLIKGKDGPDHQKAAKTEVKTVEKFSDLPGVEKGGVWENDPIIDVAEKDDVARSTENMDREMLVSVIRVQRDLIMELQDRNNKLTARLHQPQAQPTVVFKPDPNSKRIADALEYQNDLTRQKQEQEEWDKIFEPLPPSKYGPEWSQRQEMIRLQRDQNFILQEQQWGQRFNRKW